MEPISALLFIAGTRGVSALVKSLSGSSDLGDVSGELFKALRDSESRLDARLDKIESLLDQLLDQDYRVALNIGLTRLLSAGDSLRDADRLNDLEHARTAFIAAFAAGKSPLQKAIAQRYLLLVSLLERRLDLAPMHLAELEGEATAGAFDAVARTEISRDVYETLLRTRRPAFGPDSATPDTRARTAALDGLEMCGRLLAEAAVLAPELGLPPRTPPSPADFDESGRLQRRTDPAPMRVTERLLSRFQQPQSMDPVHSLVSAGNGTQPYWTFRISPGQVLRIGSITLSVDQVTTGGSATYTANLSLGSSLSQPIVMHWLYGQSLGRSQVGSIARYRPSGVPGAVAPGRSTFANPSPPLHLPAVFTGWATPKPSNGVEVRGDQAEAVALSARPVPAGWENSGLDPSKPAIRLNPLYVANHFIIVAVRAAAK